MEAALGARTGWGGGFGVYQTRPELELIPFYSPQWRVKSSRCLGGGTEAVMQDDDSDLPWTEGYVAGYGVQPLKDNPYHYDARLSDIWVTGWRAGRVDDLGERRRSRHSV